MSGEAVGIAGSNTAVKVTALTSTSSGVFAPLLTLNVNTPVDGYQLFLWSSISASLSALGEVQARLVVDGVVRLGGAVTLAAGMRGCLPLLWIVVGLAAGAHVVELQWARTGAGTATVDPATGIESASLGAGMLSQ